MAKDIDEMPAVVSQKSTEEVTYKKEASHHWKRTVSLPKCQVSECR